MATAEVIESLSPAEIALGYHARTKHSLERYAAGPETLDWDAQPNPFREFTGAPRTALPFVADRLDTTWAQLHAPDRAPAPLTIEWVAGLLELSMGLSAWKEQGPDRWALRCNPSSGNLHPTEAYVIASRVAGLDDGLHHYVSRDHALEQRCRAKVSPSGSARLWIGLASVHWREAWKYGERAFRYCQLDVGHALGALRYAAAALGWSASVAEDIDHPRLAALMGLDRAADFAGVEREDADLLIAIGPEPTPRHERDTAPRVPELRSGDWFGRANRLDPHPMYRWPVVDDVSRATHGSGAGSHGEDFAHPPLRQSSRERAADLILRRRSAQRFDAKFVMREADFFSMLDCLLPRPLVPWDVWSFAPRLHPIFFVHRIEGLEPGLYALPRRPDRALRDAMRTDFVWQTVDGAPDHLPFFKLVGADCRAVARTVSCHQWIASDGCVSLGMLCEFEPLVRANPWRYRQFHWEAGLLGHVLYLEAEAAGLRGTGIGCYFDDAVHDLLGIADTRLQALYHFTLGRPRDDSRIMTLPAYPARLSRAADGALP